MPQTKQRHRDYIKLRFENKDRRKQRTRVQRNRRAERLRSWYEYKAENFKCSTCGEAHPACISFHHTDPTIKEDNISWMVRHGLKGDLDEKLMKEMSKCIPICENCHRKIHFAETYPDWKLE